MDTLFDQPGIAKGQKESTEHTPAKATERLPSVGGSSVVDMGNVGPRKSRKASAKDNESLHLVA